jgi:hypothetical protein
MSFLKRHEWRYIKGRTPRPKKFERYGGKFEISPKCVQRYSLHIEKIKFMIGPDRYGVNFGQWQSPYFGTNQKNQ